jgi:methyl-accepting chemotaxis protein
MEKKLAKPSTHLVEKTIASDEMEKKRELARKQAQDKVKARTLAKQQQLAERIAVATEQLASGIEEASSAAEELGATMQQIARGAAEASSAAEESRAAINQVDKASLVAEKKQKQLMKEPKWQRILY